MKNIWLVLKREYLVRVRKKSFIVMTILGPLLAAAFYGVIIYLAVNGDSGEKKVTVIDESKSFNDILKNDGKLSFSFKEIALEAAKEDIKQSNADLLVFIPKNIVQNPKGVKIFAEKNVSLDLKSDIENLIEKEIENRRMKQAGIDIKVIESTKANVSAATYSVSDEGEKSSNSYIATGLAFVCAMLIYITVLVYGTQIMRSVMEEKTNRIVEVIISSIRPFQLLMGKILGVALVGLTQFGLWIILSTILFSASSMLIGGSMQKSKIEQVQKIQKMSPEAAAAANNAVDDKLGELKKAFGQFSGTQIATLIFCFFFYFLGGYLMYGALFGAIGAAVDSETDTQQFMMPIMLPLIASISLLQPILNDPDGNLAFWASIIPFTSPILMMVRLPFGVPTWELLLSMALLVLGFVGTIWLAGRIYRVGILMYGKKVNFKELSKWIFYKG